MWSLTFTVRGATPSLLLTGPELLVAPGVVELLPLCARSGWSTRTWAPPTAHGWLMVWTDARTLRPSQRLLPHQQRVLHVGNPLLQLPLPNRPQSLGGLSSLNPNPDPNHAQVVNELGLSLLPAFSPFTSRGPSLTLTFY